MKKSEIYTWRISPELKSAIEEAARAEGASVARLLDRIVSQWLLRHGAGGADDEAQQRLRAAAQECCGTIRGGDPFRSAQVRQQIRARLSGRRGGA